MLDDARRTLARITFGTTLVLKPDFLLSRHPILCGLMQLAVKLQMRNTGETVALAWGTIAATAHLYNALRKSRTLQLPWPDMNLFICIQTPAKLFIGSIPKTLRDCVTHFHIAGGTAASNSAKDRRCKAIQEYKRGRKDVIIKSQKGARDWTYNTPLLQLLQQRYLLQGRADKTLFHLDALFEKADCLRHGNCNKAIVLSNKTHQAHAVQLLEELRNSFCRETHALNFDYYSMHDRCLNLLRVLYKQMRSHTCESRQN